MDKPLEIELEGHRLAVDLVHPSTSGVPVFFLHGIGSSIAFWTPEMTALFHHLGPCYALSLPGHFPATFPKDFPADCLTAELIARLTASAIQKTVGNRKVLVVGHSTGGFAALNTAVYHPEVIAGVVSIAGFAKGQWTGTLGLCQWLVRQGPIGCAIFKKIYQMGGLHPIIFRTYWQVYVNNHFSLLKNPCFRATTDSTLAYFRKLDVDAMVSYFKVMPHTDITSCLSKITAPSCLITGDKDPIVPPKESATIAEKVPSAKLMIIKGSGHLPFFERPEDYEKTIERSLEEFQAR